MLFNKFFKHDTFHITLSKIVIRNYKTSKKINIGKLITKNKIKNHEKHSIEDIELLLHEKHHDVLESHPTIKNVNKIIDVNYLPVFKKNEKQFNILNKIVLHFGDLSYLKGDAVVNGTNKVFELMKEGNGYDCSGNFLKTCGDELLNDMKNAKEQNKGKSIILTKGYNSSYKHIIHVVEPYYNQTQKLKNCYENVLLTAKDNNFKNVVFPLLGSGISLFKKHDVVISCLEGIYEFMKKRDNFNAIEKIILCTITDSYWMLLRDSIYLYLDINI
ncbi:Appr-1-p processing domain protein [Plasmodium reichenowi]|uniref:Appr-1-p processing domain protein n=1 Tax=Plasmodium reichenowi TaxID=5854 RepID=A0A151L5A1_PLARE|nr:Appr-1-p processing domain protein [Plasmodium reichenowi]KYN94140.1 Appr-1-p processing domain protein [Plasmodium reichenowi]